MNLLAAGTLAPLLVLGPGRADDHFIRGDANGDGRLSVADVWATIHYKYFGGVLDCVNAADALDDGIISDEDATSIVMAAVWGETSSIPEPTGEPGPDPTPNWDPEVGCKSYGGGTPFPAAVAKMAVRDAVAQGGWDPFAVITLALSTSEAIAGCQAHVRDASGVVADYSGGDSYNGEPRWGAHFGPARDLTGTHIDSGNSHTWSQLRVVGGDLSIGYAPRGYSALDISPRMDADALEFTVCLRSGTKAGTYPLYLEQAELAHRESGQAILPALVSGTITVLEDVHPGLMCCREREPASDGAATAFEIGDAAAALGEELTVPVIVTSDRPLEALSASIDFDETLLEAKSIELVYTRPDGNPPEFEAYEVDNEDRFPGSAGPAEGYAAAAVLIASEGDQRIPAGAPIELLRLQFRTRARAWLGATEVRFVNGGRIQGHPIVNSVIAGGSKEAPPDVLSSGHVTLLQRPFIRGDSNRDGTLDLSDAQRTLASLFLGTESLSCEDAADSNDDGKVDVSDAVQALSYLFLGGTPLPPPRDAPGPDPTVDRLTCAL